MSSGLNRRGTRNGAGKLNEQIVRDIRARYRNGTGSNQHTPVSSARQLATEYGINKRTVLAIVYGETWGWVD